MKKTRFTETRIKGILRRMENGGPVSELCREHGMSSATVYKWRAKFGGMDASPISEMKAMAEENRRLKRMHADVSMQNDLLNEALGKKWHGPPPPDSALRSNVTGGAAPGVDRGSGGDEGCQHRAGLSRVRHQ